MTTTELRLFKMKYKQYKNLSEVISKRTYNQKVYDNGKRYRIHIRHIHYKSGAGFEDIDTTLAFDGLVKKWKHNKASYYSGIPEYADDWFEFYNAYEGANHTIKARPITSHVKGVLGTVDEDDGQGRNWVRYKDAFGTGIDLKVAAYWHGLRKVICINNKPADTSKDIHFDFELDVGNSDIRDKQSNVWNKGSILNFSGKTLKIGKIGKESYFRNAHVWDSEKLNQPVNIQLYKQGGKLYIRKTITKDILEKAVYPLYTDHPTNYDAGAGDGYVSNHNVFVSGPQSTAWTNYRADVDGESATPTATTYSVQSKMAEAIGLYTPEGRRAFFPIDTSGIADGATITAAVLKLWITGIDSNTDNDGDDTWTVIATTQANTNTLATTDWDTVGYAAGSNSLDFGSFSTGAYNSFTLNATGRGWIDKEGVTKIGVIEGHDLLNNTPQDNTDNSAYGASSEDASGTKDPYLDITVSESIDLNLSDSISIAEDITILLPTLILNISDSISIAEDVVVPLPTLNLNVFDSISILDPQFSYPSAVFIAEDIDVLLDPLGVILSDSITIVEAHARNLVCNESLSDSLSIAESISMNLVCNKSLSDSISLAESISRNLVCNISISDAISIAESNTWNLVCNESLSDSISLAEDIAFLFEPIGLTLSESISIAEDIKFGAEPIAMTLSDSITIIEYAINWSRSLSDSITITENISFNLVINESLSDSISIADVEEKVLPILLLSLSDSISIADAEEKLLPILLLALSDSISIADTEEKILPVLFLSLSDSIAIAESEEKTIQILFLSLSDSLSIAESETILLPTLLLSLSDSISISDSQTIVIPILFIDINIATDNAISVDDTYEDTAMIPVSYNFKEITSELKFVNMT